MGLSSYIENTMNESDGLVLHRRVELLLNLLPEHPICSQLRSNPEIRQAISEMPPEEFKQFFKMLRDQMHGPTPRKRKLEIHSVNEVLDLIRKSKKVLVLTGAGISTSCGIPDFRSANGVYSMLDGYQLDDPQDLFSIHYFKRNVKPFYDFARRLWPGTHKPAPTHYFIKNLEVHEKLLKNYTQNIDTLEDVAGFKRVLQCHGSFATATCTRCKYKCNGEVIKDDIMNAKIPLCPKCIENPRPSLLIDYAMKDTEIQAFRVPGERSYSITSESDIELDMKEEKPTPESPFTKSANAVSGNSRSESMVDRNNSLSSDVSLFGGDGTPPAGAIHESDTPISGGVANHTPPPALAVHEPDTAANEAEGHSTPPPSLIGHEQDAVSPIPFSPATPPAPPSDTAETMPPPLPLVDVMFDKGIMKPDIVFFGESLPREFFDVVEHDVKSCDLVIVAGTSLKVAPVSKIIEMVDEQVPQILINREVVAHPHEFDVELLGNCDNVALALGIQLGWGNLNAATNLDTSYRQNPNRPHQFLFEGAQIVTPEEPCGSEQEEEEEDRYDSVSDHETPPKRFKTDDASHDTPLDTFSKTDE